MSAKMFYVFYPKVAIMLSSFFCMWTLVYIYTCVYKFPLKFLKTHQHITEASVFWVKAEAT